MYKFCLARQVNEIELLKSIYCEEGELSVLNETQYDHFKEMTENSRALPALDVDELPTFVINIRIPVFDGRKGNREITMNIRMPPFYPSTEQVNVAFYNTSKVFSREQEKALFEEIDMFSQAKLGQECILDLVQLTKDWLEARLHVQASSPDGGCSGSDVSSVNGRVSVAKVTEFKRILIWFSTIAPDRAKIVCEWARQLGLTGFSKFGTPAIILTEGDKHDIDEYITSLRSFRWKRMDILFDESWQVEDIDANRKFSGFADFMVSLIDLQPIFRSVGLEDMYKEGLKIHAPNLKIY